MESNIKLLITFYYSHFIIHISLFTFHLLLFTFYLSLFTFSLHIIIERSWRIMPHYSDPTNKPLWNVATFKIPKTSTRFTLISSHKLLITWAKVWKDIPYSIRVLNHNRLKCNQLRQLLFYFCLAWECHMRDN